jgi:hypothetical protein
MKSFSSYHVLNSLKRIIIAVIKPNVKLFAGTDKIIDKRVFGSKKDNHLDSPYKRDGIKKCPRCGWPD